MEFLVEKTTVIPETLPTDEVERLHAAEAAAVAELAAEGSLLRLWRRENLDGNLITVGLWAAPDTLHLTAAVSRLPLRRWMTVNIIPLHPHDNDPAGCVL